MCMMGQIRKSCRSCDVYFRRPSESIRCTSSIYRILFSTFSYITPSSSFKHSVALSMCMCVCVRETWNWGVVYTVFIWVAPFPLISLSLQHLLFISQLHYLSVSTLSLSFPLFQSLHAENQTAYGFWVNNHYNCCLFLIGLGSEQPSNSKYIIIYIWFKDS